MSCYHRPEANECCAACERDQTLQRRYGRTITDMERLTDQDWKWIRERYENACRDVGIKRAEDISNICQ